MSHRPYIKDDDSGNISDLAIDAETLQGYKPCVNIVTLEDNNSTKEGTWLAKTNKVSALVDGQLFLYKITVAGASTTTLNITGSGGALGAKTVYRTGTTKLTTQYGVGHYILLAYNSLNTCFRLINDYDANSYAYVRQYQHGKNAAGATNLYPILTRYNLTNKNGTYDNAYARFYTDTYIDMTNGYLYAPKVYSGGSEVAVKTDIPTETTVSNWGFTKNIGTVTKVNNTLPDSSGNVAITLPTKSSWNYDDRYVRFDTDQQGLTELEQIYARINIGAGTSSFSGSYNDLTDKPYECIKQVPIYTTDNDSKYIFLWGLKEDTHTLYFVPEGNYFVYARGTSLSDRDGNVGTFFGPGVLIIHNMGSNELRYTYYEGYSQDIKYGSVQSYPSSISPDYYECSPIVKGNFEAQTGTPSTPLYIKYTSPTHTDGANYEFAECSVYAGGTNVTLNGTSKSATTASFYAPTSSGTSGQFLKSSGSGAPTWETVTIPTKSSWNYDDVYVKYNASQSLTDAQKSQARTNIGAGTSSLAIGTTSSTAAAGNHTHSTTLSTDSGTPNITMAPNTTYKLSTGGTNVIFKTPSDAYKIVETLRKGSEADSSVGYYKIATINHSSWNFCDFCMLVKNSYAGVAYSTIFSCSCSDSNVDLRNFKFEIISGTNISDKLAYLYTYDSNNNLIKIEIFIHCTRFEHPMCYIINARTGQQLVIPTQDEFNKATPDKPDGTTMTGYATYIYDSMYQAKGNYQTKKVTGSWSVSTTNPKPMVDIILAHPNINIYYKAYTSGTKKTTMAKVLYYADHSEVQGIYTLVLRYVNASGNLTTIGGGTIYYEYFD